VLRKPTSIEEETMKRLSFLFGISFAVVVMMSFLAAGPVSAAKPLELKMATVAPPVGSTGEELKWYASEIEKRTNGSVKIKIAWAGSLAGPKEMPEAIRTGAIDIAHLPWVAFAPSLVPLHSITMKCGAFRGGKPLAMSKAAMQLHKEFPEFDAEYAANNMILAGYRGSGAIGFDSRKAIKTIDDLKGLKVVVFGPIDQVLIKAVGAVPVAIMVDQVADSLQKGIVDAAGNPVSTSVRFKVYEGAKYYIRFKEPAIGQDPGFSITMNLDTWKTLSPEQQKVFAEVRDLYADRFAQIDMADATKATKTMQDAGIKFIDLPASETARWKALINVQNLNEEWVKFAVQNTKIPETRLREILARYMALLDEYAKKYPQSW
jgi:TRAP-type transport system periplasmic protein